MAPKYAEGQEGTLHKSLWSFSCHREGAAVGGCVCSVAGILGNPGR